MKWMLFVLVFGTYRTARFSRTSKSVYKRQNY